MEKRIIEQLESNGFGIDRVGYIADTAMRITVAAVAADSECIFDNAHKERATWVINAAEALWDELCERYHEEEDGIDEVE